MQREDIRRYLAALFANAPAGSLIELRFRSRSGMRRAFHGARDLGAVAGDIALQAPRTDVYVGVLPRRRHGGGRDDLVAKGDALWVDCDTRDAVAALPGFAPTPSIVVASGTGDNRHAYWLLSNPVDLGIIESTNRRLARALGADRSCADPARILRPPSLNHKHQPPTAVSLERCEATSRSSLSDLVSSLPETIEPTSSASHPRPATDDPLLRLSPAVYVAQLLGVEVPRSGKVRCPFHRDRTPSLHAYREPERGWYCFGCRQGGSVYDLVSLLWQLPASGPAFSQLRQQLVVELLGQDDVDRLGNTVVATP